MALTDPKDVARVESKTFIVTKEQRETAPTPMEGVQGQLAKWMSPEQYAHEFEDRFPGCMKGTKNESLSKKVYNLFEFTKINRANIRVPSRL